MQISLLTHDPRLLFITLVAAAVSLLTTLVVAARPAAVRTGRVALAFTISAVFFMVTRFANLFYLPMLGAYVDRAAPAGVVVPDSVALNTLYYQIEWVVLGAAVGTLGSWLMLPTFVELYCRGIRAMERYQSMLKVLKRVAHPRTWPIILRAVKPPSLMGVRLGNVRGLPIGFLIVNVVATAIWTVGALCASLASARAPQFATTAILLSGMVNAFALMSFTLWVDPVAALITDQAVKGSRPSGDVDRVAVHLAAGNFLGALLGTAVLEPGTEWIQWLTEKLASHSGDAGSSLLFVIAINCLVTLLQAAANMDRVSAVLTKRVATATAVYNVFFLITRVAGQVYAPILGSMKDYAVDHDQVGRLGWEYQLIILGASLGVFIGVLLMPTFIEIYKRAINELELNHGSMNKLMWKLIQPRGWKALGACGRRPTFFGVRWSDRKDFPASFLWGNVLVTSITTVGVMAAIYAGANHRDAARTATLLSAVVNGLATITLSVIVNPMAALVTDQCVSGQRPQRQIYSMSVLLTLGMFLGTLLSQVVFWPAEWFIGEVAVFIQMFFGHHH